MLELEEMAHVGLKRLRVAALSDGEGRVMGILGTIRETGVGDAARIQAWAASEITEMAPAAGECKAVEVLEDALG